MKKLIVAIYLALVLVLGTTGCQPAGIDRQQAEAEVVTFIVDTLIMQQPGSLDDAQPIDTTTWTPPPDASLLIWSPVDKSKENDAFPLDRDEVHQAWWIVREDLYIAEDAAAAYDQYIEISGAAMQNNEIAGVYYEFGVLKLSNGNQLAEVYVGTICGPLCGAGYVYLLERNADGVWEKVSEEMRWIS